MTTYPPLSPRQSAVAELVARGYSNGQIARQLCMAEQTVKNHLWDSYAALGWTGDAGNQRVLLALWWLGQAENPRTNAENDILEATNKQADVVRSTRTPALTPLTDRTGKERYR